MASFVSFGRIGGVCVGSVIVLFYVLLARSENADF